MLNCSTCGDETNDKINILKDIHICKNCVYRILTLYIYLNPIKSLCPFCQTNKDNIKCHYCNISEKMKLFKYENL